MVGVRRTVAICAMIVVAAFVLQGIAGIVVPVTAGKPPTTTTFSGTVQESLSSPVVKIVGARVDIVELGVYDVADSNGDFAIANVPLGTYTVVCSCTGYDSATYENQYISSTSNYLTIVMTPTPPQWLYMLYIMADIDYGTDNDFYKLDEVLTPTAAGTGLTEEVKVVYVVDRMNNWPDAPNANARYYEMRDHTPILLQDLGEVNMGDPATLSDFVIWAESNYPASKTCLIIAAEHGDAWISPMPEDETVPGQPGVTDSLSVEEVQQALATAMSGTLVQLDVLNMIVCLMQMVEVDYELRGLAKVIVDSQDVSMYHPYDMYIGDLIANPSMDAAGLGTVMVNDYASCGVNWLYHTMSAIDMSGMSTLASDVDVFADYLLSYLPTSRTQIVACRDTVQENSPRGFIDSSHDYIDLYDFVDLIDASRISQDPGFLASIESVRSDLDSMIIANSAVGVEEADSHGLAIYFPRVREDYRNNYHNYRILDFTTIGAPSWSDFMLSFFELSVPVADFSYSVNHNIVSFDPRLSWDSDGQVGWYSWDFGDGTTRLTATVLISHTYVSEGSYTVTLEVRDFDYLWSDPVSTAVYTPGPNIPPVLASTYVANDLSVSFYDASSDSDGYIADVGWDFGDGYWATGNSVTHTYAAAGTYVVLHSANDDDGAYSSETSYITVEINAPPSTPGVPTVMPGDELDGTFTLTWTASVDTDLTPVAGYCLAESVNGGAFTYLDQNVLGTEYTLTRVPGSYLYSVCAFDTAVPPLWSGWATMNVFHPIVISDAPPTAPGVPTITPGDELDGTYTLIWAASSDTDSTPVAGYCIAESVNNGQFEYLDQNVPGTSYTLTRAPESYLYSVCAFDSAVPALWSPWTTMNVLQPIVVPAPDSVPPVTTATLSGTLGSDGWYTSAVTVTLSASDSNGIKATYYKIDNAKKYTTYMAPFQISADGKHLVYFYSVDNKGYTETPDKSVSVWVDTVSPETSATPNYRKLTIALSATEAASGVAAIYYKLDSGTTWLLYTEAMNVTNGTHTIYFYSVDNAGWQETQKSQTYTF